MRKINFHIMTSHSLHLSNNHKIIDDKENNQIYNFTFSRLGEKIPVSDSYLIADELCQSNLPFLIPRSKRVALLYETSVYTKNISPSILKKRFDIVLTHKESFLQMGHPFYKTYFSTNLLSVPLQELSQFKKSKLTSFIGNIEHNQSVHGYSFRSSVAKLLINNEKVDCYGKGIKWINSKLEALKDYCFSVAMENCKENYYFTEKIIDCFLTETIPIYWGCPKIDKIFDPRGMICFDNLQELEVILQDLSFEKYQNMLPFAQKNKEICINSLLDSFDGFLLRCARTICEKSKLTRQNTGGDHWLQTSKLMGKFRKYCLDS
ncbi:glycosyltransferase family 10 domain-containing protein [Aphanizomenon sp. UHCC 0183]|uniref:glycosyltransferase family 10 domain-containing protein n=1 Tax=Aphanizomenon sp. UHCC 0183 TaxID=2590028 RepID=UPI001445EB89|nr:glycosyltransferase family 10 [Aphanizomenon sp. UHCC 0183]MTJ32788.1 hypothetical protein [Aphanizomenon sp. UHCC 0183]